MSFQKWYICVPLSILHLSSMGQESFHYLQSLPSEVVPNILSATDNLDTLYAFRQTCTTYRAAYPIPRLLDELLPCTNLEQLVPKLNETQHARILVHYAQKNNDDMFLSIRKTENDSQLQNSLEIFKFFGYEQYGNDPILFMKYLKEAYLGKHEQKRWASQFLYRNAMIRNNYHAFTVLLTNNIPYKRWEDVHSDSNDTLLIRVIKRHHSITKNTLNYIPLIKLILHHNVSDKDEQNYKGNTALHYACEQGSIELVKILIEAGCNLNIQNNQKKTPLHCASFAIADLLIKAGADIHINDKRGKSALSKFSSKNRRALLHSAKTKM